MKYVTAEDIERYQQLRPGKPLDLLALVNFFCEGAVTSLSNFLYDHIAEEGRELRHGIAKGCRCLSCWEWQIVDEDGQVIDSAESLVDWAQPHGKVARQADDSVIEARAALDVDEALFEEVETLRVSPFHQEAVEDVLAYVRTQPEEQARATMRAYYAYKLRFEALKRRVEPVEPHFDQDNQGPKA